MFVSDAGKETIWDREHASSALLTNCARLPIRNYYAHSIYVDSVHAHNNNIRGRGGGGGGWVSERFYVEQIKSYRW